MTSRHDDNQSDVGSANSCGSARRNCPTIPDVMQTCGWCSGTTMDDNPCPKRHPGENLVFASTTECLPCRNYINSCLNHMPRAELKEDIKNPKKMEDYKSGRRQHCELFNETPQGKQLRDVKGKIVLPEWISKREETGTVGRTMFGVFHPEWTLTRDNIPYQKGQLEVYEGETGMFRDPGPVLPRGCTEVYKRKAHMLTREKQLQSADNLPDPKKLSDNWKAMKAGADKAVYLQQKTEKGEDGIEAAETSVRSKRQRLDGDEDSWDLGVIGNSGVAESSETPSDDAKKGKRGAGRKKRKNAGKGGKTLRKPKAKAATAEKHGTPTKASGSTKKPMSPPSKLTGGSAVAKVYPSVQMRDILKIEQLNTEAAALLDTCQAEQGFLSTPTSKCSQQIARLEAKLTSEAIQRCVIAQNEGKLESGEVVDLHARGKAAWAHTTSLCDKLTLLKEVMEGYKAAADDPSAMNASPSFLHRAFCDAKAAGTTPPMLVLTEINIRQALSLFKDGNVSGACCTLRIGMQVPCGMSMFEGHMGEAKEAQVQCAIRIVGAILEEYIATEPDTTVHALKSLKDSVADSNTAVISDIDNLTIVVQHRQREGQEIDAACNCFNLTNGTAIEEFRSLLSGGHGRQLLSSARTYVLQRGIDEGSR